MATYNKILDFAEQIGLGVNLNTDALKIALVRATDPIVNTDTVLTDVTQPTGTGYTAGGEDTLNTYDESPAGTGRLRGTSLMWTATAADWQSWQYVVLQNSTVATGLICWWDYGSPLTLGNGETFSAKFSNAAVGVAGNIFTLT